jgi:hypothetical protein
LYACATFICGCSHSIIAALGRDLKPRFAHLALALLGLRELQSRVVTGPILLTGIGTCVSSGGGMTIHWSGPLGADNGQAAVLTGGRAFSSSN